MRPDAKVIDPQAIERLGAWGGADLPRRMIEIFLTHTHDRVLQIRKGVAEGDATVVEGGAHSLKSSAGNVGASQLQGLCEEVEKLAGAKDFVALEELLEELGRAYAAARQELENILEGMTG